MTSVKKRDTSGSNNNHWKGGKAKCLDCGKLLSDWVSKRCRPCWSEYYRGQNHRSWKGGVTKKVKCCPDCGETLRFYLSKYCLKCCFKHRANNGNKKEQHYAWKGGRQKCVDCSKEVAYKSTHCASCAKIGERNANWNNGASFEPYPTSFNKAIKQLIRERDKYSCVVCGISEQLLKRVLGVHHIDYNKQNCDSSNLVALCNKCHGTTNYNRDKWVTFFRNYLNCHET